MNLLNAYVNRDNLPGIDTLALLLLGIDTVPAVMLVRDAEHARRVMTHLEHVFGLDPQHDPATGRASLRDGREVILVTASVLSQPITAAVILFSGAHIAAVFLVDGEDTGLEAAEADVSDYDRFDVAAVAVATPELVEAVGDISGLQSSRRRDGAGSARPVSQGPYCDRCLDARLGENDGRNPVNWSPVCAACARLDVILGQRSAA
jgi:hypothetical protein